MKRIRLETKHYQWGLTAFLVVVCCVLAFFAIYRFDVIQRFFSFAWGVLAPFVYGLVMAYLVCPVYNATVRGTYSLLNRGERRWKYDMGMSKGVGTIVSVLTILVVIFGVMLMVLPGLINSIIGLVERLPAELDRLSTWINANMDRLPIAQEEADELIKGISESSMKFATDIILPHSQSLASGVTRGVVGFAGFLLDFVIGIIISVYFLNSKDTFLGQIKKVITANFKEETAEEIFEGARFTNRTFGGFISGKVIDSIIIGIICFIVMTIFGWEYSLLISCIVGITNIIPFFGPFIGAIPSALLLFIVNPMHALYFIILILLLQQFDGNILGPKILGDSTGLASFWVLFAVLVGGGLFGFIGMIIGIPVFAVIYHYLSRAVNSKLRKKGYSTDLNDYRVDTWKMKPKKKDMLSRFGIGKKKNGEEEQDAKARDDRQEHSEDNTETE